jgi:hypothetical protein
MKYSDPSIQENKMQSAYQNALRCPRHFAYYIKTNYKSRVIDIRS